MKLNGKKGDLVSHLNEIINRGDTEISPPGDMIATSEQLIEETRRSRKLNRVHSQSLRLSDELRVFYS